MAVTALPMASQAAPAQQGGTRHFPETNQDVSGRFLEVWESGRSYGDSLYINGLPLTDVHDEISLTDGKIYKTQWFERARFEAHPENQKPYDVLLGLLGVFAAEGRKDTPFKTVDNPGGGVQWFPETKHTLGDSSTGGKAIAKFWNQKGGLSQFGFPISQPFQEVTRETDPKVAGKSFLVQYFERQRFEYHPENAGTPFEVLLGRLGAEQKGQVPVMEKAVAKGNNPVDVLRIGRGQDPATLIPWDDNTLIGTNVRNFVYNGLTKRDDKENVVPDLAAYVPTLDNGGAYYVGTGDDKRLVVKYKLKRGVKWFDGQPFDSNDVIFTYKLVLNPDFPAAGRQPAQYFASVDNPDPYTLIFNYLTWKEAAALIARDKDTYAFLQAFVDKKIPVINPTYNEVLGFILPQHALAKMAPGDIDSSDYSQAVWGTGPYHVTKFQTGQTLEMERNPNYSVTPDKPSFAKVSWPLFSDNKQLPVGIATGTLDLTTSESITPDLITSIQTTVEKAGKGKLLNQGGYSYEHIDFNVTKEPFNDVRVRQALAYSLDRNAINNAIFGGQLTIMNAWIPPTHWASAENPDVMKKYPDLTSQIVKYDYNVAKANELLDAAGWVKGADGIRSKNGKTLKVDWLTTSKAYRKLIATAQQQYLKAVGFDSTPDVQAAGQVFANPPDGPLYSGSYGNFGVIEFAWQFTSDEIDPTGLFDSTQIPSAGNGFGGGNDMFWSNADADKYGRDTLTQIGRTSDRIQSFLRQQIAVSKDIPTFPMFGLPSLYIATNNFQNLQAHAGGYLADPQMWYLGK
ncbi:MAG TPA: peptide ABC transporter substrate-binding protein [Chloroflexia bacterium]